MKIARGKARKLASRKLISSSRFKEYRSASIRPKAGLTHAVDLYRLRHELRTPLTGILGLAELLAAKDLPGHAPLWLATLQACGQQMASLIDRSLRPDIQTGVNDPGAEFCIRGCSFLEQLICSHWPAARAGNTQLFLLVQPQACTSWRVDPVLLRQALDNLLANAIRFSPDGYVLLEARVLSSENADSDILQLVVENCGPGHSQKAQNKNDSTLQIADADFPASIADGLDYAERSYPMFSRGQGLQVVEQVCSALHGQLQHSFVDAGRARFVLLLPAVILGQKKVIQRFGPNLLRKRHCLLLLGDPVVRVVSALLAGMGLSFEYVDRSDETVLQALPEKQLLICDSSRLPAGSLAVEEGFRRRLICLVSRLSRADKSEWYVQPLPEPLFQAGLQAALLRCLVEQGIAARQGSGG